MPWTTALFTPREELHYYVIPTVISGSCDSFTCVPPRRRVFRLLASTHGYVAMKFTLLLLSRFESFFQRDRARQQLCTSSLTQIAKKMSVDGFDVRRFGKWCCCISVRFCCFLLFPPPLCILCCFAFPIRILVAFVCGTHV